MLWGREILPSDASSPFLDDTTPPVTVKKIGRERKAEKEKTEK